MSSVIARIIIALFCLVFLQCYSLVEKLKEIAEQREEKPQEEPLPLPQDDTDVTNERHRKSAD
jgi:hypothetical protein